jgi:hypothetical protein
MLAKDVTMDQINSEISDVFFRRRHNTDTPVSDTGTFYLKALNTAVDCYWNRSRSYTNNGMARQPRAVIMMALKKDFYSL